MTYREQYNSHSKWQERVLVMNLFHCLQVAHQKKWGMKDTAEYFGVSIGLVSENLLLAVRMKDCAQFDYRQHAIDFIKREHEQSIRTR